MIFSIKTIHLDFFANTPSSTLAALSDGGFLAVGPDRVNKYTNDGTLDTSFGINGSTYLDFGLIYGSSGAYSVNTGDNGEIFVSGQYYHQDAGYDWKVYKLTPNGQLDNSFGENGFILADIGGRLGRSYASEVLKDGSLFVTGYGRVAKFKSDGQADKSFGLNGIAEINTEATTFAIRSQQDGKLLIGGGTPSWSATIWRLNQNGQLDNTFGLNGLKRVKGSSVVDLKVIEDGKIVGGVTDYGRDYGTVMLLNSGTEDSQFGDRGYIYSGKEAIEIDQQGRLLIAGTSDLYRLTTQGKLDADFGNYGTLPGLGGSSIIVLSNGSIVVASGNAIKLAPDYP
jgi:uncharacterized delta-60 repeat protein